jgi:hypothetical protein
LSSATFSAWTDSGKIHSGQNVRTPLTKRNLIRRFNQAGEIQEASMANMTSGTRMSVSRLILVPAIITLAVTVLRLVGELQHWSKIFFNPAPGGGAAIVGISWLPIIFGPYFAMKLAGAGEGPASNGKAIGLSFAGLVVLVLGGFIAFKGGARSAEPLIILGFVVMFLGAFLPRAAWRSLGTVLIAYAFAARIPVLIVMFIAMRAGWTTHYSFVDPRLAQAPFWRQFLDMALLPQMLLWIGFTVVVGSIFGTVVAAISHRGRAVAQTAS